MYEYDGKNIVGYCCMDIVLIVWYLCWDKGEKKQLCVYPCNHMRYNSIFGG